MPEGDIFLVSYHAVASGSFLLQFFLLVNYWWILLVRKLTISHFRPYFLSDFHIIKLTNFYPTIMYCFKTDFPALPVFVCVCNR